MPIEQGVFRFADLAAEVLEDTAGRAVIALPVTVDIICIVVLLYNGVINGCIIDIDPAHNVRIFLMMLLDLFHIDVHGVIICDRRGRGDCRRCRCRRCRQNRNRVRCRNLVRTADHDNADDDHRQQSNSQSDQEFFQLFYSFSCQFDTPVIRKKYRIFSVLVLVYCFFTDLSRQYFR